MRSLLARAALPFIAGTILVLGSTVAATPAHGCEQATVTLTVTWDRSRAETVSGVVARLSYPPALDVPVDDRGSAQGRVENRTGESGGLFDAVRKDTDGDGKGDLLNVGLITEGIAPGDFVRIRFDCRPGTELPPKTAFRCTPDVADEAGKVEATCSVAVAAG